MATKTTWPVIRNTIRRNANDRWTAIWAVIDHLDRHGRMIGHTAAHGDLIEALDTLEQTIDRLCEPSMGPVAADECAAAEDAVVAAAEACPEVVCERLAGESFADEDVVAALDRCDFRGWWPVIDGDRRLTGELSEGGGQMLNVDDEAMIHASDARAAGWRIDTEEGTAEPSEPVIVEFAVADETIRMDGGIDEFAGVDHPAMAEACAAYREAATRRLGDDDRANRMRADGPVGQRRLHSQWRGARWGHSSGAIGTMARDLTGDEQAAIDAAHDAGLAAAKRVIEEEDDAIYGPIEKVLTHHGDRYTGTDVRDAAEDWDDHGFDADEVDAWATIGCWDAATAAAWRDAGLSPEAVAAAAEAICGSDDDDPIYSACNGDRSPEVIIEAADAE